MDPEPSYTFSDKAQEYANMKGDAHSDGKLFYYVPGKFSWLIVIILFIFHGIALLINKIFGTSIDLVQVMAFSITSVIIAVPSYFIGSMFYRFYSSLKNSRDLCVERGFKNIIEYRIYKKILHKEIPTPYYSLIFPKADKYAIDKAGYESEDGTVHIQDIWKYEFSYYDFVKDEAIRFNLSEQVDKAYAGKRNFGRALLITIEEYFISLIELILPAIKFTIKLIIIVFSLAIAIFVVAWITK